MNEKLPSKYEWLNDLGTLPKVLQIALPYFGEKEIKGKQNNPNIMNMAKELGLEGIYISDDTMAYCALAMNYWLLKSGKPMVDIKNDKYNLLRARYLLNWGNKVEIGDEKLGDVVVLGRDGGGHTALFIGKTKNNTFIAFGGNQGDQFKFSEFSYDRLLGIRRYYATQAPESAKQYIVASDGKLSTNEA